MLKGQLHYIEHDLTLTLYDGVLREWWHLEADLGIRLSLWDSLARHAAFLDLYGP